VAVEVASGPDARRAVFGAGGKPVGEIITLTTCVHAFEKPFLGRDAYIAKQLSHGIACASGPSILPRRHRLRISPQAFPPLSGVPR